MPECRELKLLALILVFVLLIRLGVAFGADVMQLIAIWIDPTIKEILAEETRVVDEDSLSPAEQERRRRVLNRQAYSLPARSTITRGSSAASGRSHVWPEGLSSLRSLRLLGVDYTARSIILDFGARILTVRLINHTSVQVYRRSQWETSVRDIPADKDARQFKIAIALEFSDFVIAFLSADLVFEPHWYDCIEDLHDREPPPAFAFAQPIPRTAAEFNLDLGRTPSSPLPLSLKAEVNLARFCTQRRRSASRSDFAIFVVRRFESVFPGEGVYSVSELFARAGLSVYLTEAELFDNPSRVARLLLAMYAFLFEAHYRIFKDLVRPAVRDTILAPTAEQRINCGKSAFKVFAKMSSRVTRRLQLLQEMYEADVAASLPIRYDLYEPAFMASALEQDDHLARLAFGTALVATTGLRQSSQKGPLEVMFGNAGLLDAPTFLNGDLYQPALPPDLSVTAALVHHHAFRVQTNAARTAAMQSDGQSAKLRFVRGVVWTYVRPHPSCIHISKIHMLGKDDMLASSFETVVKHTKQVVVGPLEWFGNGIPATQGRRFVVGTCLADPVAFPLTAKSNPIIRNIKGRERRRFIAANPASAGAPMPSALAARQKQQISAYRKAHSTSSALASASELTAPRSTAITASTASTEMRPSLIRRRRLHADAKLVLSAQSLLLPSDGDATMEIDSESEHALLPSVDTDSDGAALSDGGRSLPPVTDTESDGGASLHNTGDFDSDGDDVALSLGSGDVSRVPPLPPLPPLCPVSLAIPDHPVYASTGRTILEEENCSDNDVEVSDIIADAHYDPSEYEVGGTQGEDEDNGSEYQPSDSSADSDSYSDYPSPC